MFFTDITSMLCAGERALIDENDVDEFFIHFWNCAKMPITYRNNKWHSVSGLFSISFLGFSALVYLISYSRITGQTNSKINSEAQSKHPNYRASTIFMLRKIELRVIHIYHHFSLFKKIFPWWFTPTPSMQITRAIQSIRRGGCRNGMNENTEAGSKWKIKEKEKRSGIYTYLSLTIRALRM